MTQKSENQPLVPRKKGRSPLTEGQTNVILSKVIDKIAAGNKRKDIYEDILKLYKDMIGIDLHPRAPYEIYNRAKNLWLTNLSLPGIENYRKERFFKSEALEEEIREESSKDIVDQAGVILKVWQYQDALTGISLESQSQNLIISIDLPKETSIKALEIDDENKAV